jgi:hypothetical protein
MSQENADRKLDQLFRAYREACPDVEAGPNFMPQLWQKIERRQNLPFVMRRFARVFASAAAAACLVMSLLLVLPSKRSPLSYLDVLDQENPPETLAYADIDEDPLGESGWQ